MAGRLEGRIAVVTGASRGIGAAIATAFAREGARVVIASRKAPGLEEVAGAINAEVPGAAVPMVCHVGKVDLIPAFFDAVEAEVGRPDALVNNAGTNPYFGPMVGAQWPAWDKTFEVNLKGPFEMSRQFAQRVFAAGATGSIVNVSSMLGQVAAPLQGIYGMTKAALLSMTRTLAVEWGEAGLRVNAIAPGLVDTRLAAAIVHNPQLAQRTTDHTALKRVARPDEIAGLAVHLASDESSYTTGQTFFVDGGYTVV